MPIITPKALLPKRVVRCIARVDGYFSGRICIKMLASWSQVREALQPMHTQIQRAHTNMHARAHTRAHTHTHTCTHTHTHKHTHKSTHTWLCTPNTEHAHSLPPFVHRSLTLKKTTRLQKPGTQTFTVVLTAWSTARLLSCLRKTLTKWWQSSSLCECDLIAAGRG
jgi:hypothetical protein